MALDRGSPVPPYFQVASRIQQLIENGELPVGGRLENEVELADRLGVSRPTIRRAIGYLVGRGMLGAQTGCRYPDRASQGTSAGGAVQPLRRPGQERPAAEDGGAAAGDPPGRGWPTASRWR
jgi:DNA-binding FadR family transcriptional regulator